MENNLKRQLKIQFLYEYEPELFTYLRAMLEPNIVVAVGKDLGQYPDFQVLIDGRPNHDQLTASPNLHTLIVPWVGIPPETRELLSHFPKISVHNIHYNAAPVAEGALALLLAAAKFIIPFDQQLRQNDWTMRYATPGPARLLNGRTALVLGYGAIGRRVARVCAALDMTVLATKRHLNQPADEYASEIHPPENLKNLLPRADVLIITLPLTTETENLIGENEFDLLPEKAILVNVGRGPIVNEAALYNALKNGRLCAAGLDVWYNYPAKKDERANTPPSNYPFNELENVVMSPHRTSDTNDSDYLRMVHLAEILNAISNNEPVPNKVDLSSGY